MKNRIRELRKAKGLTQEELGSRIGMATGHLSRLERGEVSYTQDRLETIARELGCRPADLIDDRPHLSPDQQRWLEILEATPAADRPRLLRMAEVFADPATSPAAAGIDYRQGFRDPPTVHEHQPPFAGPKGR